MTLSRNARIASALAVVVVPLAAGLGAWAVLGGSEPAAPDPNDASPEQVRSYLASKAFGKRPVDERLAYLQALQRADANSGRPSWRGGRGDANRPSEAEREQLRRNIGPVMRRRMERRVEAYFELPEGPERTAHLDELIDAMEARRRAAEQRRQAEGGSSGEGDGPPGGGPPGPPHGGRGGTGGRGGGFAARMKQRIEGTPPEQRARFVEFMKAMRARMEERGIRPGRGGGRGRGGR